MCTDIKAISKSNACAVNPTSADDRNPADHVLLSCPDARGHGTICITASLSDGSAYTGTVVELHVYVNYDYV